MLRRTTRVGLAVLVAAAVVGCAGRTRVLSPVAHARDGDRPADLVILGARVFTGSAAAPWAEAVAARGGRIVYVGPDSGADPFVGPDTRVIPAGRRLLVPGFVDNHCHFLWIGALQPLMVNLYDQALPQMRGKIQQFSAGHPGHPFLLGVGWTLAGIPGGNPDRILLDSIVADRPVFLWSNGGQEGWVNSAALRRMQERNPAVYRQLDPVESPPGEPTGLFLQFHAFNPFDFFTAAELPPDLEERMLASAEATLDRAVSFGVTAFNDSQIHESFLPTLLKLRERGAFADIRARGSLYLGPHAMDDEAAFRRTLERWRDFGRDHGDGHFWMGDAVKLYMDGVYLSRSAWLHEPYATHPDSGGPAWKSLERFEAAVRALDALGIQVGTHATGDRAITTLIDVYERVQLANGTRDPRHRIEHCELPTPADQKRMAALGIHAAMHPAHFFGDQATEDVLGRARMQRMMPWASLEKAGVEISFGSDWIAGPDNPLYGLLIAGTRLNHRGDTDWGPDEKISLASALGHATLGSARALRRDHEIGSIETGKYADFVLFDDDILDLASPFFLLAHDLENGGLDGLVLLTIVDGRIVYKRPGLRL